MSSVPKQTYGLLQSRKPVWKSTSRRRPERIHVDPQIRTPAVSLRAWISISAIADQNDSRRSWAVRVVCWGNRLSGIASLGSPSVRGANACSSVSRGHLADARPEESHRTRAALMAQQRARLTLIAVMGMDGNIWRRCDLSRRALWRDPKSPLRLVGSGCGSSRAPFASARLRKGSPHRRHREPWPRRAGNPACRLHRIS